MSANAYIETSVNFDFRVFLYRDEISVLPLTPRALDYLESATGRESGFWAVNVSGAQLIEARSLGFRCC
jgi:hypothetical protein